MQTQDITFQTRDGVQLMGTLRTPDGDGPWKVVVLCHGWASNRHTQRNVLLGQRLADAGLASLAFDFRAHGESDGDYSRITIPQLSLDINAAWIYLMGQPMINKLGMGIVGASIGATAAVHAMSHSNVFTCGVLISPRLSFEGVRVDMYDKTVGERVVQNRALLPDALQIDFYRDAAALHDIPLKIIHGTADEFIPITQSEELVYLCPRAELDRIEGGSHTLHEHRDTVVRHALGFLLQHLA